MTFIELLYFVVTSNLAFFAARWVYFRKGWLLAIITFALVWGPCLRFFFTGGFGRLVGLFVRPSKTKDQDSK